MDTELKRQILKSYLKELYQPDVPEKMKQVLRPLSTEGRSLIVLPQGFRAFNAAATFFLVKDGRKNYRVLTSTQVIEIYLGKDEMLTSYRDLIDPVVIVTVWKHEVENKRRWELIYQLAVERLSMGKGLTVFTQVLNRPEEAQFRELGFEIVLNMAAVSEGVHKGDVF